MSDGPGGAGRLRVGQLVAYGVTDMPIMMSLLPALVFIPRYYSADLGVPLATVGTVLFVTRLIDVFTDPLMGYVSDRTRWRLGRRRPWLLLATPILMLSIYRLYFPEPGVGAGYMLLWMSGVSLGMTMILIPYYAWGAELSDDYQERSRITGWARPSARWGSCWRSSYRRSRLVACCAIGGTSEVLRLVGITILVTMPLAVLCTTTFTAEPKVPCAAQPLLPGLKLMFSNTAFLRLVGAFFLGFVGLNITTPLYIFFVADVLGAEAQSIYMLACFFVATIAGVPFWVWLGGRIGKHNAYIAAYFLIACAHPFYLLLGEGDFWWMLPITVVTGMAAGGFSQTLPNSMKADVVEADRLASGEQRAALFFRPGPSRRRAPRPSAASSRCGRSPGGASTPGPARRTASASCSDCACCSRRCRRCSSSPGALLVWRFPIDAARQAEIRAELDSRERARDGVR